jgi:NitT/TauT family transport system substrate-binding protein
MRYIRTVAKSLVVLAGTGMGLVSQAHAETIRIAVVHQSMCTDTYTAGIVIKELKHVEKDLPKTGKYADADYKVS